MGQTLTLCRSDDVVEGEIRQAPLPDGTFVATEILAKHDENYMPPQLAGQNMHKSDSLE